MAGALNIPIVVSRIPPCGRGASMSDGHERVGRDFGEGPLWEDGPMTLDESVHGMRLRVIERAQVQGNVSAVCREFGISRPALTPAQGFSVT
jgi:hypothetical protein